MMTLIAAWGFGPPCGQATGKDNNVCKSRVYPPCSHKEEEWFEENSLQEFKLQASGATTTFSSARVESRQVMRAYPAGVTQHSPTTKNSVRLHLLNRGGINAFDELAAALVVA
jgi:hypothetical protein